MATKPRYTAECSLGSGLWAVVDNQEHHAIVVLLGEGQAVTTARALSALDVQLQQAITQRNEALAEVHFLQEERAADQRLIDVLQDRIYQLSNFGTYKNRS